MAEFATSIEIAAPPAAVFDYLVTEDGMTAWMGQYAELDARPGGRFAVDIAGSPVRGEYLHVEPSRRVVVSWGFAGSSELPSGASRVEFTLTPTDGGTRLDLVHSGLPDSALEGHAHGWAHFVPRLAEASRGIDLGPDDWRPLGS